MLKTSDWFSFAIHFSIRDDLTFSTGCILLLYLQSESGLLDSHQRGTDASGEEDEAERIYFYRGAAQWTNLQPKNGMKTVCALKSTAQGDSGIAQCRGYAGTQQVLW